MRGGTNTRGYTIVEVMVFMAVSGLMFIMAAGFINGKQARSEFQQGMHDINSQVQQTIGDVSNGFSPSSGDFICSAGSTGGVTFHFSPTPNTQGGNQDCAFIGKVIQFGVTGTNNTGYNIYTIVGRQFQPNDNGALIPPANFADAMPVAATSNVLPAGTRDLTETKTLELGLQVDSMFYVNQAGASTPIGAVGFFSGFNNSNNGNSLESGAAAPIAVPILSSTFNQGEIDINDPTQLPALGSTPLDTNPEIVVCFRGGVNQYGRLSIGSDDPTGTTLQGQRLISRIQISSGAPTGVCPP